MRGRLEVQPLAGFAVTGWKGLMFLTEIKVIEIVNPYTLD